MTIEVQIYLDIEKKLIYFLHRCPQPHSNKDFIPPRTRDKLNKGIPIQLYPKPKSIFLLSVEQCFCFYRIKVLMSNKLWRFLNDYIIKSEIDS